MAKIGSNSDLFRKKQERAAVDVSSMEGSREKTLETYLSKTNKEKEYVNISLLDPAPDEWNFFPGLTKDQLLKMKFSIMENGIMVPCVLWEQENGRYMILAGHNRVRACREILSEYHDVKHKFDYTKVPAIVYKKNEIDSTKAQEIVVDTNFIQRGSDKLDPKLRLKILKARIDLVKNQRDERNKSITDIVRELDLKQTSLYEDIALSTCLIPAFSDLYFDGKLSRKAAIKLTGLDEGLQDWIAEQFMDKVDTAHVLKLNKRTRTRDSIREVFTDEARQDKKKVIQVSVPEEDAELFLKVKTAFLHDGAFYEYCKKYVAEEKQMS